MYSEHEGGNQGFGGRAFTAGVFTGIAIGAAVGLLFAPRRGAELREQIVGSASGAGKRVSETIDAVAEAGRDAYQQARDEISRSAEQGAAAVRSAVSRPRRADGPAA